MSKKAMSPIERAELEILEMENQIKGNNEPASNDVGQPPETVQSETPPIDAFSQTSEPQSKDRGQSNQKDEYYQRWKSLEGIVRSKDAQIQQLVEQNSDLGRRVDSLIGMVQELQAQPQQPVQGKHETLKDHLAGLVDRYGEDMITAMAQVSDFSSSSQISELKSYVSKLENRLAELDGISKKINTFEERQAESESDRFKSKLTELVPDWEAVHRSPEFREWMQETEVPYLDMTYRQLFDKSNDEWSLKGVAGVFKAYKDLHHAPVQRPDPRLKQVTPASSGAKPVSSDQGQQKFWTQTEIEQFYLDAARGKIPDAEFVRIEREIDEANRLGLVAPG